jgi:pyrroloquinoline quinone biosynthesis protein D
MISLGSRAQLAKKARLREDKVGRRWMLIYPEGGLQLNGTGTEVLKRCSGTKTVSEIVEELGTLYQRPPSAIEAEVLGFLSALLVKRLITLDSP